MVTVIITIQTVTAAISCAHEFTLHFFSRWSMQYLDAFGASNWATRTTFNFRQSEFGSDDGKTRSNPFGNELHYDKSHKKMHIQNTIVVVVPKSRAPTKSLCFASSLLSLTPISGGPVAYTAEKPKKNDVFSSPNFAPIVRLLSLPTFRLTTNLEFIPFFCVRFRCVFVFGFFPFLVIWYMRWPLFLQM